MVFVSKLSQNLGRFTSNDWLEVDDRFKCVDDFTFLEVIFIFSVGLAMYNVKVHVPSDIPAHNQLILPVNLKTQEHLDLDEDNEIETEYEKKNNSIIFNFSRKGLCVVEENIANLKEAKLLGTFLSEDLKWNKNTRDS